MRNSSLTSSQSILSATGLALAFGFVLLESISGFIQAAFLQRALTGIMVQWMATVIVALIAFRGLRLGFHDLGIRIPRLKDWLVMIATLLASIITVGLVGKLLPDIENARSAGEVFHSLPLFTRLLLVITAGICEEFLFRGYGIVVVSRWTKNRWTAGLVTLFFFTIAHAVVLGWTVQLTIPCLLGAFLTFLYLLRGNLVITMAMHTLIDLIGIVLVPLANER